MSRSNPYKWMFYFWLPFQLSWVELSWVGLGWVGLGWIGLGEAGLGWVGLDWVGLGWIGLGWVGFNNSKHKKTITSEKFQRFTLVWPNFCLTVVFILTFSLKPNGLLYRDFYSCRSSRTLNLQVAIYEKAKQNLEGHVGKRNKGRTLWSRVGKY